MVAFTGIPSVDFVLSRPEVQRNIRAGKINRKGQVPLLAGADEYDDSLSHIDSRFPRSFPRPEGGSYNPDPHLHVHETVEKWVQQNGPQYAGILGLKPEDFTTDSPDGMPRTKYGPAHYGFATPAEKASVEADGVDWGAHNAHTAGAYSAIKGQTADASPSTLYDRPYRDDGATGLLKPSKEADMDYPYGGLLGNSAGGMSGLFGGFPQIGYDPSMGNYSATGGNYQFAQPQQPSSYGQQFPGIAPSGAQDASGTQYPGGGQYSAMGAPPFDLGGGSQQMPPPDVNTPSAVPVSNSDPSAVAAGGSAPPPSSSPPPSSGFLGPQNADILSTLGGALLQGPTVRQGLAIAGQQLPGVLRQSRANNATADWLAKNMNIDPATRNLFMQNPQIAQQVAERMMLPQWQWTAIGRDMTGQVTYGFVNPQTHEVRDAAGKPVDAAALQGGGGNPMVESIAKGIESGTLPPDTLKGNTKLRGPVLAQFQQDGFDFTKATEDYTATQKRLATLNGAQQTRLRQAISFTNESLDTIDQYAQQWDAGQFGPLNHARMVLAKSGALGQQAQSIATNLDSQIADLTSELGTVYKGGNSSTDESLKLAASNLSSDWSYQTLKDNIARIRQNLTIRQNSMNLSTQGTPGNPYDQGTGAATAPAGGGPAGAPAAAQTTSGAVPWQSVFSQ